MQSHEPRATVFEFAHDANDALARHKTAGKSQEISSARTPDDLSGRLSDVSEELTQILDAALFFLNGERDAGHVVECLVVQLHDLRAECAPDVWQALVPMAQAHPIREKLMADPFTRQSFEKPRGYSGDGVLLDLLYRHPAAQDEVEASSQIGQAIYAHTSISSSARAVQERRQILARFVDTAAARHFRAEILTVASGHLREADLSTALVNGQLARWIAMDHDEANLAVIAKDFAGTAVEPMSGSIKGLMTQKYDIGTFDLVYSAGVYDYLPFEAAVALTRRLLVLVRPGGTLLFGNFSTEVIPAGYMETFMNWSLIFRNEAQMREILDAATAGLRVETEMFFGRNRHILYAQITMSA